MATKYFLRSSRRPFVDHLSGNYVLLESGQEVLDGFNFFVDCVLQLALAVTIACAFAKVVASPDAQQKENTANDRADYRAYDCCGSVGQGW
jgi:hypothetical protein